MTNPMRLNEEATSTPDCADAETAQPTPPDELTAEQLAGRACVECGATGKPMRVVGEVPGHGDVYECDDHSNTSSTTETHGDVTYQVTPAEDGLVSYKPLDTAGDRRDRDHVAVVDIIESSGDRSLSAREAALVFRIGCFSAVIAANELDVDVRDHGYTDVEKLLSAQEINKIVFFVRDLLAKRAAVTA